MNCWTCERPAQGICIFCGRAVCKDHASELPHLLGIYQDDRARKMAIVVEAGVYCGTCRPRDEPVHLENL